MRLEDMAPAHVRRAIRIYIQHAYDAAHSGPSLDLSAIEAAHDLPDLLACFTERPLRERSDLRRWTLRLGNQRYPFMKFVVQEYLVGGEFFFSVDTHDNLEVRPGSPDYAAWQELKLFNRNVKERIEAAWRQAHLPTHEDLRLLAEEIAHVEREEQKRFSLLLVDDEQGVASGLRALLEARGYRVELAYTGESALERLAREPRPDLLMLDLELPELSGEDVLGRVRADPRLADLPVLMATASSIELSRVAHASGFLRKPFQREVLFAMIARLLEVEGKPSAD